MPSLTGLGASSTSALASFRPRPVAARTTLITWIFLSPAPVRITSNVGCSSSAAAAVAAAAAAGRRGRRDGRRRHAELLLERLDALGELEHRDALELLDPILCVVAMVPPYASDGVRVRRGVRFWLSFWWLGRPRLAPRLRLGRLGLGLRGSAGLPRPPGSALAAARRSASAAGLRLGRRRPRAQPAGASPLDDSFSATCRAAMARPAISAFRRPDQAGDGEATMPTSWP